MNTLELCPVCCEGKLQPYTFASELKYKNIITNAEYHSSRCDVCSSTIASHEQLKQNKLMVVNFERAIDGLLTSYEIVRIRKKLKMSQRDASAIITGGGNSFAKYESGAVRQSTGVDNILRVLDHSPELLEVIRAANEHRKAIAAVPTEVFLPIRTPTRAESSIATFIKTVSSAVSSVISICLAEDSQKSDQVNRPDSALTFSLLGGKAS